MVAVTQSQSRIVIHDQTTLSGNNLTIRKNELYFEHRLSFVATNFLIQRKHDQFHSHAFELFAAI